MSSPKPMMKIDDVLYVEVRESSAISCADCAFAEGNKQCIKALDGAAKEAFGGDCVERYVVYVEAGL